MRFFDKDGLEVDISVEEATRWKESGLRLPGECHEIIRQPKKPKEPRHILEKETKINFICWDCKTCDSLHIDEKMAVVDKSIHFDVNSDPAFGASNVNATGSKFEINLEQPIFVDKGAFEVEVAVEEATVWNTVSNISAALNNNHIHIVDGGATIDVTIQDGTYSTTSLSAAIDREYVALGGTAGLVSLDEDFPTQKVILITNGSLAAAPGVQVDFTPANTFRDVIGFTAVFVPVAPTLIDVETLATNEAAFNNIEYFLIHWDGGQGFSTNATFQQSIARVNIDARPGSQIVSTPFNPAKSTAESWAGNRRNHLTFWLTNEDGVTLVDTGEVWSARLVISWKMIVNIPSPLEQLRVQLPETMQLLRESILTRKRKSMLV